MWNERSKPPAVAGGLTDNHGREKTVGQWDRTAFSVFYECIEKDKTGSD